MKSSQAVKRQKEARLFLDLHPFENFQPWRHQAERLRSAEAAAWQQATECGCASMRWADTTCNFSAGRSGTGRCQGHPQIEPQSRASMFLLEAMPPQAEKESLQRQVATASEASETKLPVTLPVSCLSFARCGNDPNGSLHATSLTSQNSEEKLRSELASQQAGT